MRLGLPIFVALLLALLLAPSARAQGLTPPQRNLEDVSGPYSTRFSSSLAFRQSFSLPGRGSTALRLETTVLVPDRGEALMGSYGTVHEGRNEFGAPVLGKTPILNRGSNNVGYGRSVRKSTVSVRARVIILAEEEERQTGVQSRASSWSIRP